MNTFAISRNPVLLGRAAAFFYLLQFAFGPAMIVLQKVFVVNDAARTASNILANETFFRLGYSSNLIAVAAYIVVTALFYALFKPVSKTMSFLAACFSLTGCAVLAFSCIFYFAPLIVLKETATPIFSEQLALMFLKLYGQGYNLSLAFFACYCLVIGYLVFRSTFLPRAIGIAMMIAGLGWLTFFVPAFARTLYPYVMLAGVGELALTIWLAIGIDADRWHELNGVT